MEKTETNSLTAKIFNIIEDKILVGEYSAGDSLAESKVCGQLGVSRTPVREALKQLERAGLVAITPNKGAVVVGISEKDIRDIMEVRLRIEGLAANWAAKNITDGEIQKLQEVVDLLEFYIRRDDFNSINEMDSDFHEIIYQASKSKILANILSEFHHYLKKVRYDSMQEENRRNTVLKEHRQILNALAAHDSLLAEKLACEHVQHAAQNING